MQPPLTLTLQVTIRPARRDDLLKLEWFGLITPYRDIIEAHYARAERGEIVFLVAEANAYPIGQVWIDLVNLQAQGAGLISALRVIPTMQNLGIGSLLLRAAEEAIREHRLHTAELGVGKDNPHARRLYERLGYEVVSEIVEQWSYTTPEGEIVHVTEDEWVMRKPV